MVIQRKNIKLSKSKFMTGCQCLKRLYLLYYEPDLAPPPDEAKLAKFEQGYEVGRLATQAFPGGVLVEEDHLKHKEAVVRTRELMADDSVLAIFEAAFTYEDVHVRIDILERIEAGEYKRSEIAVIYDDKTYGPETFTYHSREVPHRLRQLFEHAGIPVKWISEDVRAKEMFDITTDRLSLVSIHSAKGLDFDLVYFVSADLIRPTEKTRLRLTLLLYVALTRAKHRLIIPYVEETELVGKMRACLAS